jgi:hypothetical protein
MLAGARQTGERHRRCDHPSHLPQATGVRPTDRTGSARLTRVSGGTSPRPNDCGSSR